MESLTPYQFRQQLSFIVDIDERGWFKAHVENQNGKTVFSLSNEDEAGWPGPLDLVEDGFMKHSRDMSGLLDHLRDIGIARERSTLIYSG